MKPSIILTALFASVCLMAEPLWADDEANTSGRTAARLGMLAAFQHPIVGTVEEIQDYINDELQRNHVVKSEGLLKTSWPFTVWATEAENGILTNPRVVFFDPQGKIREEWSGDEGEIRVDAKEGHLVIRVSKTQIVVSGVGLTTSVKERKVQIWITGQRKGLSQR